MRVYIAGPVTKGDQFVNLRNAVLAADLVLQHGHTPFVPHLYGTWQQIAPRDYETWMKLCIEWLKACHVLVRLPGESAGADREVDFAKRDGMEVLYGIESWIERYT